MADFDARWERLTSAARRGGHDVRAPSERRIAELARLVAVTREPRSRAVATERRLLVAAAVLLVLAWLAWAPDSAAWRRFTRGSTALVAALPDRVPRAPRLPSARATVRALPDFGGFFESLFSAEVSR